MFERPTILLLGAGARAPYGYSIGPKLIENIVEGLNHVPDRIQDKLIGGLRAVDRDFLNDPYRALVLHVLDEKPKSLPTPFCESVRPWKSLRQCR